MKNFGYIVFTILLLAATQLVALPLIDNAKGNYFTNTSKTLYEEDDSTGHFMFESELAEAVGIALADPNFAGMRDTLVSYGYEMMLENSMGIKRDYTGDFL